MSSPATTPILLKYGTQRRWIARYTSYFFEDLESQVRKFFSTTGNVILATNHPAYGSPEEFNKLPSDSSLWHPLVEHLDVIWVFDDRHPMPPPKDISSIESKALVDF